MGLNSIEGRLALSGNRPSGFDYMRIVLSISVLVSHTINVCYGKAYTMDVWASPARPFLAIILPLFFTLSGFLVAGSLQRSSTLVSFLGLRLIRLVPALVVDTVIAALILGPIFTTLPLSRYLADPTLHSYFLNIVGEIHFLLPGVFADNPWGAQVNQQLWTLPYELKCYGILTGLAFLGLVRSRTVFLASVVVIFAGMFVWYGLYHPAPRVTTVSGPILLESFLFGVAGYLFRDVIPASRILFAGCLLATLALLSVPIGDYLVAPFAAYVTIYLGVLNPRRSNIISSGDYSYGIFLYGFPIQQAVVATLGATGQVWYINLIISLVITAALAVFSWWCVEKPALRLRTQLFAFENWIKNVALKVPLGVHFVQPAVGPRLSRSGVNEAS